MKLSMIFIKKELGLEDGMLIDDADILVASTALAYDAILVTANEKHFSRIENIKIENWTLF